MDLTLSDLVHFGSVILFGAIPILQFFIFNPMMWIIRTCFTIITTVLYIVSLPIRVPFNMLVTPIRYFMSIMDELTPLFLWLSNAVIIGITAGGCIALMTMGIMSALHRLFPQLRPRPEPRRRAQRRARLPAAVPSAATAVSSPDISSSSSPTRISDELDGAAASDDDSGPAGARGGRGRGSGSGLRWRRATTAPLAAKSAGRRRAPDVLVDDTIHEEESSE
ncbi:hypothetical protein N656DRAFT_846749 [Canariomyces notabilis]|uniref:Uncharacterized protein n=1 Tax=Canariomyces notabilis TaxID=2074819 RepID=A0AAN6QQS0_9PEZI|nr:hypothetical protein N656DRAFT_846749 [Canariomyces arenarius]